VQVFHGPGRVQHVAAFYQTTEFLIDRIVSFVSEGLAAGDQVIVLATLSHWNAVAARLESSGIDNGRASAEGRLVLIDAEEVLASITEDGHVSVDRFRAMLSPLISPARRQRIYGELVSLLLERGEVDAAIAIEALGQELSEAMHVRVLCGYHAPAGSLAVDAVGRIERVHDHSIFQGQADASTSEPDAAPRGPGLHAVRFYEDRQSLARLVGQFLGDGLLAGQPAIVIATPEHSEAIRAELTSRYIDLSRVEKADDLIIVDAEKTLGRVMVHGQPDPAKFQSELVSIIERAGRGRAHGVIRAYGEMVDLLWKRGETAAAVRLEMLWNQLGQAHAFALLCGYSMGNFYKDTAHQEICGLHTHVV
jgi:KaiC/GvpD/RAD55 family RecA-like ATPase